MKTTDINRTRLLILTYLAFLAPYFRFKKNYVTLQKICKQYLFIDIKLGALRKEFFELKKNRLITTKNYYGKKVYIISPTGRLYISPRLPTIRLDPWDKKWRVIVCKIPCTQKKIKTLAINKIKKLGFREVLKGTFISPHPFLSIVEKHLIYLGVRQYNFLFETDNVDRETASIKRIWELEEINKKYRSYYVKAKNYMKKEKSIYWPLRAKILEQDFICIRETDPNFPNALLPRPWNGEKALEMFKKVTKSY